MLADAIAEVIGAGVLAPAAIAFGIYWIASRLLPDSAATRDSAVIGLLAGFVTGYILLPDWAALKPERHWHWLPWLGVTAGLAGSLSVRAAAAARWTVILGTSMAAAWFLVPTWASLEPPRVVWLVAVSAGLCLLTGLADPLPARIGGRMFLGLLALTAVAVAVMVAACVSVTYARIAGLAACALVGVWGGVCLKKSVNAIEVRAVLPAAMILVGGIAFVACIESERPQYGLVLLPAAPLGVWSCRLTPLARLTGRTAALVQIASVVIPLLAAAGLSYARVL